MKPICKFKSLMTNLNISNDLVDRIKVVQSEDEELKKLFTSLEPIPKGGVGVDCVYHLLRS